MSGIAVVLYLAFALVQVGVYLSIRRRWASPLVTATAGVFASIMLMLLVGLAQGNSVFQAAFAALIVGGLFSGGVLAMAWYFHSSEVRQAQSHGAADPAADGDQPG